LHPRFRAEGVVEEPQAAFAPFVHLATDTQRTIARHDQRQMHDHARIGDAVMRQQVRVGASTENITSGRGANMHQRCDLEGLRRPRASD